MIKRKAILMRSAIILFVLLIAVLFQNCSGYVPTNSANQSSVTNAPDKPEEDLRPLLSCIIVDSGGRTLRRISNISNSDETSALISEGNEIDFNCADSLNYTGQYNITDFTVNFGEGNVSNTTGLFKYKFKTAGTYTIEFTLKDKAGNVLKKVIKILVKCSSTSASTLNINTNSINVANGGLVGFFVYSAEGAVSGGKPPYNYAWDFNGDAIVDYQPVDNTYEKWQIWGSNATSIPVHNMYTKLRTISLTVKDSCNFTKTLTKDVEFTLPRVAPTEFPVMKNFQYVQADITRTSAPHAKNSINKATRVDLNSIQDPGANDRQRHVSCSYSNHGGKGMLQVEANNLYGDLTSVDFNQRFGFYVTGINDDGKEGVKADRQVVSIDSSAYDIAQSQEVMTAHRFIQDSQNCSMEVSLRRDLLSQVTCTDGKTTSDAYQLIILGSGNCDSLGNSYAGKVKAENIKFYCVIHTYAQCPIGVGPPPVPPKGY